jgi:hypothetical protein
MVGIEGGGVKNGFVASPLVSQSIRGCILASLQRVSEGDVPIKSFNISGAEKAHPEEVSLVAQIPTCQSRTASLIIEKSEIVLEFHHCGGKKKMPQLSNTFKTQVYGKYPAPIKISASLSEFATQSLTQNHSRLKKLHQFLIFQFGYIWRFLRIILISEFNLLMR